MIKRNLGCFFWEFIVGYIRVALAACYDVGSCGGGETSERSTCRVGSRRKFCENTDRKIKVKGRHNTVVGSYFSWLPRETRPRANIAK